METSSIKQITQKHQQRWIAAQYFKPSSTELIPESRLHTPATGERPTDRWAHNFELNQR